MQQTKPQNQDELVGRLVALLLEGTFEIRLQMLRGNFIHQSLLIRR